MTIEFAGVVLAGGGSIRMGKDKALMNWQGKTWLAHMVDLLEQAGAQDIFVCRDSATEFPTIKDNYQHAGPLGGIHSAMAYTDKPLLIVPVDIPMVTVKQLRDLLSLDTSEDLTLYGKSPLPCFLRHQPKHLIELTSILESPSRSKAVWHFFDSLNVRSIDIETPIKNFNSPEDIN